MKLMRTLFDRIQAAPGQSAESCRAAAAKLRESAVRQEVAATAIAQRDPKAPTLRANMQRLAAHYRSEADQWDALAEALMGEG